MKIDKIKSCKTYKSICMHVSSFPSYSNVYGSVLILQIAILVIRLVKLKALCPSHQTFLELLVSNTWHNSYKKAGHSNEIITFLMLSLRKDTQLSGANRSVCDTEILERPSVNDG